MMDLFRSATADWAVSIDRAIAPSYGRLVPVAHPPAMRLKRGSAIFRFLSVVVVLIVFAPHPTRAACGGWVSWSDETSISARLDRLVASMISTGVEDRSSIVLDNANSPIASKAPSPCSLGLCSKAPESPFAPPRIARVSSDSWIALSVDPIRAEPRSSPLFLEPIADPPQLIPDSIDRPPRSRRFTS